ncbi:YdaS family helix-turn-helix protein [Parasphingorhabdus sp. JC815]|uniref:transcriptional regulator n=1 Tax=Parasphingorhabdus sp. JC815 TaxID=3232140 RepID=UPI0034581FA1
MVDTSTPYLALKEIERRAGSMASLARGLGISTTAVWKWFQSTKRMPPEHVLRAEKLYGVSRHDLRPDIYPRNYPPAPDTEPDLEIRFHGTDQGNDSRMYLADRRVA